MFESQKCSNYRDSNYRGPLLGNFTRDLEISFELAKVRVTGD